MRKGSWSDSFINPFRFGLRLFLLEFADALQSDGGGGVEEVW
jgi:hypothetical protein